MVDPSRSKSGQGRRGYPRRRGLAGVLALVLLVMLSMLGVAIVSASAQDQAMSASRGAGVRADLAAEAAAQMATKELMDDADHDGDGGIGSISSDGVTSNNPVINGCRVMATRSVVGSTVVLEATAVGPESARRIRLTFSTN